MTDDLVKRLREWDCGESTWGLLEDAAHCIEKLEEEVERLQNIRHYGLRHIIRVKDGEVPNEEIYGLPLIVEGNKVYPWPAENVELYAYWKRTEQ